MTGVLTRSRGKGPHIDRGRGWSDAATSQGMPGVTRSCWLGAWRGSPPECGWEHGLPTPWFLDLWPPELRINFCWLSHQVYGNLFLQPQDTTHGTEGLLFDHLPLKAIWGISCLGPLGITCYELLCASSCRKTSLRFSQKNAVLVFKDTDHQVKEGAFPPSSLTWLIVNRCWILLNTLLRWS